MDNTSELVKEMIEYCNEKQNYSYYELKDYAIKNRPDWEEVLRKKHPRECIAWYLRDAIRKCRKEGIPHPTLIESVEKIVSNNKE